MNIFERGLVEILGGGMTKRKSGIVLEEYIFPQEQVANTIGMLFDIFRDMQSDKLIQEKELAEIEAKVNVYSEYVSFHRNTIDKGFELEKKELELIQVITDKIMRLIESLGNLDEQSDKFKIYIEQINRYQRILEKLVDNSGKYFNGKIMELNKIDIVEVEKKTEIGKGNVNEKMFFKKSKKILNE